MEAVFACVRLPGLVRDCSSECQESLWLVWATLAKSCLACLISPMRVLIVVLSECCSFWPLGICHCWSASRNTGFACLHIYYLIVQHKYIFRLQHKYIISCKSNSVGTKSLRWTATDMNNPYIQVNHHVLHHQRHHLNCAHSRMRHDMCRPASVGHSPAWMHVWHKFVSCAANWCWHLPQLHEAASKGYWRPDVPLVLHVYLVEVFSFCMHSSAITSRGCIVGICV